MAVVIERSFTAPARNPDTGEVRDFTVRPRYSFATGRWLATAPNFPYVSAECATPEGAIDDMLKRNGWGPMEEALVNPEA